MNQDNVFENYGLDFNAIRQHVSQQQYHIAENDFQDVELLNPEGQPSSGMSSSSQGQLIFVAGYPGPDQLDRLTRAHGISPEFWRRHLDPILGESAATFEDTRLPSATCNIYQLRFWTIGSHPINPTDGPETSTTLRQKAASSMAAYRERMRTGASWRAGDSIVRSYEVFDDQYFSVEQLVTISVAQTPHASGAHGKRWFSIVCSDNGRDLHKSPAGPWLGSDFAGFYTRTFPVPEHRLWDLARRGRSAPTASGTSSMSILKELPQSLGLLRKNFTHGQDITAMHEDPMYALNRIFSLFVCSEAHNLAFLAQQIDMYTVHTDSSTEVADTETLSKILHCRQLLERHVEELRYVLRVTKSSGQFTNEIADSAATMLNEDLLYLIERAVSLRNRSETSINLLMSVASIGEARRSVAQNKNLFRFTIIASVYVPLTFVATIFGMNFRQFGQGDLSVWLYFVVSAPMLIVSALFLFIDLKAIRKVLGQTKKRPDRQMYS